MTTQNDPHWGSLSKPEAEAILNNYAIKVVFTPAQDGEHEILKLVNVSKVEAEAVLKNANIKPVGKLN